MQIKDDIDFLVHETMNHNPAHNSDYFDFVYREESEDEIDPNSLFAREHLFKASGIIFRVIKNNSMFMVKSIFVMDAKSEIQKIKQDLNLYPKLNLSEQLDLNELDFYPVHSEAEAQNIIQLTSIKRFPLQEEYLLNISDPSLSWWGSVSDKKLEIYFSLSRTDEMNKLIKFGPIADIAVANMKFQKFGYLFSKLMGDVSFSVSKSKVELLPSLENETFEQVCKIFTAGEFSQKLQNSFNSLYTKFNVQSDTVGLRSLEWFLKELASVRRFWMEVEKKLS
jgi:hypothetical protein